MWIESELVKCAVRVDEISAGHGLFRRLTPPGQRGHKILKQGSNCLAVSMKMYQAACASAKSDIRVIGDVAMVVEACSFVIKYSSHVKF